MTPDFPSPAYKGTANWPNVSNPLNPTPQDHANHTTQRFTHSPEDVGETHKALGSLKKAIKLHQRPQAKRVSVVKRSQHVKRKRR